MVSKSGCLEWLKERTILEKALLSLSSILLLSLLITILIGATYQGKKSNPLNDEETCWSEECIQTAGEVLKVLKPEAEPCRNFYDYACGKYGQEPEQRISVARRSTESLYLSLKRLMESQRKFDIQGLDDVRNFYNTCVAFGSYRQEAEDTGSNLMKVMREFGVDIWPIMNSNYDLHDWEDEHKLERYLANLILLDIPVAFNMEVVPDQKIAGSYLVKISPGRAHETGRTLKEIRADIHLKSKVFASFSQVGQSSKSSEMDGILVLDGKLSDELEKDKDKTCDSVLIAPEEVESKLRQLFPEEETTTNNGVILKIDWDVILSEIRNKTGIVRPFAVELHCTQKIKGTIKELRKALPTGLTNYLGWRFFSKFVEHVIPAFEKPQFGKGEPVARWRVCLELMEKFSYPILAELLSREIADKGIQEEVEKISDATLSAAKLLVTRASWMSDVQRSRIEDKVSKIRIRYPYIRQEYNRHAVQIVIPKTDINNYIQVVLSQQREIVIQRFRRLMNRGTESSGQVESWKPLLTEVDNFASSDFTAYVYFDKIRTPYVQLQSSQWMNYGGLGMFIAREVSKILMELNSGVGNSEEDLMWNVWSQYTNSEKCLPEKTMFSSEITNKALQKIFLDHSTLEIAYQAAKSTAASSKSLPGLDFSDEQLFFVSYAQTICEADFQPSKNKTDSSMEQLPPRVRFLFINKFKNFGEVFSCKSDFTCQIWG